MEETPVVVVEEPVVEPVVEEPVIDRSVIEEPAVVIEEPIIETVIEEPIAKESVVVEPATEEVAVDEPVTKIEEPVTEEVVSKEQAPGECFYDCLHFYSNHLPAATEDDSSSDILKISTGIAGAAAIAAGAAIAATATKDSEPEFNPELKHTETLAPQIHDEDISQKVTETVDESTAHRKADEEIITEPAPQKSSTSVHGSIVAEEEVPKILAENDVAADPAPTVIVSSPVVEDVAAASGRTVEIIQPTPAGEIFANSVWNHSVSPFLHFSLETSSEGVRQRNVPEGAKGSSQQQQPRPASSGSDIVSTRAHRNIMNTFWQVFFFGWLGGVGRFFGGMFGKRRKEKKANKAAADASR